MNSLGMISAYSAYTGRVNSVYGSNQTDKTNRGSSDDENSANGASSNDDINDEAIISDEAVNLLASDKNKDEANTLPKDKSKSDEDPPKTDKSENSGTKTNDKDKITQEQQQEIAQLKARDAEVRTHEQAHIAAAAGLRTSAPSYDYETGPDGKKYAIGGEVNISFTRSDDLQEDIQNAETMRAAALAPAQPSSQDLSVAKNADKIIEEDRQKLAEQKTDESNAEPDSKSDESTDKSKDKTKNSDEPNLKVDEDKPSVKTGLNQAVTSI